MLTGILRRLFGSSRRRAREVADHLVDLEHARTALQQGDRRAAIAAFEKYLKVVPTDVVALNDLGYCYDDIGDPARAHAAFELAQSLDDNFGPVVVNRAKMLADRRKSAEALSLLRQVKAGHPEFTHTDAVYAGLAFTMGQVADASHYHLRSWLADFDSLRKANCFVFHNSYQDIEETRIAAEHRFWAETLIPFPLDISTSGAPRPEMAVPAAVPHAASVGRKVRIGYWSPDLRNHSVRYFLRPLLENHDRSRFEVHLYHDFPHSDGQTASLREACDHFHAVYEMSDPQLLESIRNDRLDILVELAGHSSNNRLSTLQARFATLQLTALGYPPTTGLVNVDAKIIDAFVAGADDASCYTEFPLALPSSFWCFDPMENAPIEPEPPAARNGYVTFACVGNICKINGKVIPAWRRILEAVPGSRLVIRSINFEDDRAVEALSQELGAAGLPVDRIEFLKPASGAAFFASYNEVDIILDTFPFNGGTTTCFSTYMGVPVVSLAGRALSSRMGLSILSNLGLGHLAVETAEAYAQAAIDLAADVPFLRRFRAEARSLYQSSGLGNGALYAREFETACLGLLRRMEEGAHVYETRVPVLPANEIVRRAYAVQRHGNEAAVTRILDHCLKHHPDSGSAHLLIAQRMAAEQELAQAMDYLLAKLDGFAAQEQIPVAITVARYSILLGQEDRLAAMIDRLAKLSIEDEFDLLQMQLLLACQVARQRPGDVPAAAHAGPGKLISVLIPCDDNARYAQMKAFFVERCRCPADWQVSVTRCDEATRHRTYLEVARQGGVDMVVIIRGHLELVNPNVLVDLMATLEHSDIVSFQGASRWARLDWRLDAFAAKAGGFLVSAPERPDFLDLCWLGAQSGLVVDGQSVLDGGLLAMRPGHLLSMEIDLDLVSAGCLLEEVWVYEAGRSGSRLAVHRNLGVLMGPEAGVGSENMAIGRCKLMERYGFNPFEVVTEDSLCLSAPIPSEGQALAVANAFAQSISPT